MMDQSGNFRLIARYNWRSARYIDLSPDIQIYRQIYRFIATYIDLSPRIQFIYKFFYKGEYLVKKLIYKLYKWRQIYLQIYISGDNVTRNTPWCRAKSVAPDRMFAHRWILILRSPATSFRHLTELRNIRQQTLLVCTCKGQASLTQAHAWPGMLHMRQLLVCRSHKPKYHDWATSQAQKRSLLAPHLQKPHRHHPEKCCWPEVAAGHLGP